MLFVDTLWLFTLCPWHYDTMTFSHPHSCCRSDLSNSGLVSELVTSNSPIPRDQYRNCPSPDSHLPRQIKPAKTAQYSLALESIARAPKRSIIRLRTDKNRPMRRIRQNPPPLHQLLVPGHVIVTVRDLDHGRLGTLGPFGHEGVHLGVHLGVDGVWSRGDMRPEQTWYLAERQDNDGSR